MLIHPQSIIHSLVAYDDGSVLAQLGLPDMRTPISYALSWPRRMPLPGLERLDLAKIGRLDFLPPDAERFPSVNACQEVRFPRGAARRSCLTERTRSQWRPSCSDVLDS